jgi:patatin-like phospholipase/acyl hydrolase
MADRTNPSPEYAALLNEVCVGLGYCGCVKNGEPSHVDDFVPGAGLVTADRFAEWLVLAENMNPSTNPHLKDIRRAFVRHMGAYAVDAKVFG